MFLEKFRDTPVGPWATGEVTAVSTRGSQSKARVPRDDWGEEPVPEQRKREEDKRKIEGKEKLQYTLISGNRLTLTSG